MTTHFKNGVTNVVGKDGGSSVFGGIKQPLITGGYEQEQAYQNDFSIYNASDWTVTSTGGSDFQLAQYAAGWLRQGDNDSPAAGEVQGDTADQKFGNLMQTKNGGSKPSIAVTDVSDLNTWVGFAQTGYADSDTLPTDGIGFSHLQDTTTIQFVSTEKRSCSIFWICVKFSRRIKLYFRRFNCPYTNSNRLQAKPTNSVRLGFLVCQPAGSEIGVTANPNLNVDT